MYSITNPVFADFREQLRGGGGYGSCALACLSAKCQGSALFVEIIYVQVSEFAGACASQQCGFHKKCQVVRAGGQQGDPLFQCEEGIFTAGADLFEGFNGRPCRIVGDKAELVCAVPPGGKLVDAASAPLVA